MKDGICPKCGSNEVSANLRVSGGQAYPPDVDPGTGKAPLCMVTEKCAESLPRLYCRTCGYTEFYAENYNVLNEGRKKGYASG